MTRTLAARLFFWTWILPTALTVTSAFASDQEQNGTAWTLAKLMQDLAQVKKARATFVEHKHLSMLTKPLLFSGTLEYTAPSRLEKNTLLPKPESLILNQDKLVVKSGNGEERRTLSLQEYPALWAFVESIRSTLAGDIGTLERFYHVTLNGHPEQWQLELQPSDPKIQSMVSEILIKGSFAEITTIEIREAGGDYSVMRISRDDS